MDWLTIALAVLGLVLLVVGADMLVGGASRLARSFGVSPLVVGLTVVAFGTSAPELAVTLSSAVSGKADIALGNVVGSNIANILLILGISALLAPLAVSRKLIRFDLPLMIVSAAAVWLVSLDGNIGSVDGTLLTLAVIVYTVFIIRQSRRENLGAAEGELPRLQTDPPHGPDTSAEPRTWSELYPEEGAAGSDGQKLLPSETLPVEVPGRKAKWLDRGTGQLAAMGLGLLMLVLGAGWMVDGAVLVARALGLSELVIGLTIVAVGTSLPELATSVLASIRGERDIAVGNAVGSNLFNVLAVLGVGSILSPGGIPVQASALAFDIPVMVAVSLACLPVFFTGSRISRGEGLLFLGYYALYVLVLVLAARGGVPTLLSRGMLWGVLPISVLALIILAVLELRKRGLGSSDSPA